MLSHWKYCVRSALFWLSATALSGASAQVTGANPYATPAPYPNPYATPAPVAPGGGAAAAPGWNQPYPGYAPLPGDATVPPIPPAGGGFAPPGGDGGYYAPSSPSPGFDYFDEEDEGGGGYAGGAAAGGGEARGPVKDSIKFVGHPGRESCKNWGNALLGPTTYSDRNTCEFELNQKVDRSSASIEDAYDQVELLKLKKVIHGDLANRVEANKYNVSFDSLKKALQEASKKGCTCQK